MKILILNRHNSESVNGLKKIILSFINLCEDSDSNQFYYGMQSDGPLTDKVYNKERIINFNIKRNISISDLINIIKLIRIAYKYKIDIVHAHAAKPGMIARIASLFCSFKVIYTPNNWYFEGQKGLKRIIFLTLEKILSFIPNQTIVAVTESEKNMILNMINKNAKVTIIYDGIDFKSLEKNNSFNDLDKDYKKIKDFKASGVKIIGSIIRLDPQKNPMEIIKYASFINKNIDDNKKLLFIIIGNGSLYHACKKHIKKDNLNNVILLGFKENYSSYFPLFDYTLFVSKNEGLPLVMIESVFNNKKIITTNFRGADDFVTENIGMILKSKDVNNRALELLEYIDSDKKDISINKNNFINKFSTETMINKYIKLYHDTI